MTEVDGPGAPTAWKSASLRRVATCRDDLRAPVNAEERAARPGDVPYWGANAVQGTIDEALLTVPAVLLGEDGAPFFDPNRPVAFYIDEPIWPNNHIHVLVPRNGVDGRWLAYALNAVDYSLVITGSTRDKLTQAAMLGIPLAVPPSGEQRAIADFLDEQTSRIDTLVDKQTHLITTLRERRAAVTDHLVWSGLDPTLPTSSTGIDTAPGAPSHWARTRAKVLLFERDATSVDGSEELLTVSHLTGITPRSQKNVNMTEAESHEGYRIVEAGDLVINTMWAWMGALGISQFAGMVSPAYGVYGFRDPSSVDRTYFDGLLRSTQFVTEMTRHSRGVWSSRLRLYPDAFLRLPIVVPPLSEQRAIAVELCAHTSRIDTVIAKTERHIELAKERRAALITAAVSGQIDVRAAGRATEGVA